MRHGLSYPPRPRIYRESCGNRRRRKRLQTGQPDWRELKGGYPRRISGLPGSTGTILQPDHLYFNYPNKKLTYGGYTNLIGVDERFDVRVDDGLNPAAAAELLSQHSCL